MSYLGPVCFSQQFSGVGFSFSFPKRGGERGLPARGAPRYEELCVSAAGTDGVRGGAGTVWREGGASGAMVGYGWVVCGTVGSARRSEGDWERGRCGRLAGSRRLDSAAPTAPRTKNTCGLCVW